jgi:hypothetical protein
MPRTLPRRRIAVAWAPSPGRPGAARCAVCGRWTGPFAPAFGDGLVWCEGHWQRAVTRRWRSAPSVHPAPPGNRPAMMPDTTGPTPGLSPPGRGVRRPTSR